jgi:hypothetical protein
LTLHRAEQIARQLSDEQQRAMEAVKKFAERDVDIWSNQDIEDVCARLKLDYPKTDKGNPSFTAEFLEAAEHDLFKTILQARRLGSCRSCIYTVKDH